MSAQPWPKKLYAIRGGPVLGYLEAALIVNDEACRRNGIEVATYVPANQPPALSQEQREAIQHAIDVFEENCACDPEAIPDSNWRCSNCGSASALRDLANQSATGEQR